MGRSKGSSLVAAAARKKQKKNAEKAPNRFKFKSFKEKLREISIESIRRTGGWKGASLPAENSSWFEEALMEWRELNCTAHFARFCSQVMPFVGSLPQIVFHQTEIKDAIIEHLSIDGTLAVVPISALAAMLARDLMTDFGLDTYRQILHALVRVCNKSLSIEDLEAAMKTIFYISKVLEKQLVGDLASTFIQFFAPTLVPSKLHTHQMLVELWSTLSRKILLKGPILSSISIWSQERDDKKATAGKLLAVSCFDGKARSKLMPKHLTSIINGLIELGDKALINRITVALIELDGKATAVKVLVESLNCIVDKSFLIQLVEDIYKTTSFENDGTIFNLIGTDERSTQVACQLLAMTDIQFVLQCRPVLSSIFHASIANSQLALMTLLPNKKDFVYPLFTASQIERIIIELFKQSPVDSMSLLLRCCKTGSSQLPSKVDLDYSTILQTSDNPVAVILALSLAGEPVCPKKILDITKRLEMPKKLFLSLLNAWKVSADSMDGIEDLLAAVKGSPHVLPMLTKLDVCSEDMKSNLLTFAKEGLLAGDSTTRAAALSLASKLLDLPIIATLSKLETGSAWSFNCDREKGIHLNSLWHMIQTLSEEESDLAMRHLVGIILGGFRPLQAETGRVLNGFAQKNGALFRQIVMEGIRILSEQEQLEDYPSEYQKDAWIFELNTSASYGPNSLACLFEFFDKQTASLEYCKVDLVNLLLQIYESGHPSEAFVKQVNSSLGPALSAISHLKNLHTLQSCSNLLNLLLSKFLPMGDAIIQKRALEAYHATEAINLFDQFQSLLDSEQVMRETLVNLASQPVTDVEVTIRIVYGRMIARRGASSGRTSPKRRRKLLLNYVATWDSSAIGAFLSFLNSTPNSEASITGYLTLLEPVLSKLARFSPSEILSETVSHIAYLMDSEEKNIRRLSLQRVHQLWSILFTATSVDLESILMKHHEAVWSVLLPRINRLADEYGQHTNSALMDLLQLWAVNRPQLIIQIASQLSSALGSISKVKNTVSIRLVSIIDPLVEHIGDEDCHLLVEAIAARLGHLISQPDSSKLLLKLVELLLAVSERIEANSQVAGPLVDLLLGHFSTLIRLRKTPIDCLTAILRVLSRLVPGYSELDTVSAYKQVGSWFGSIALKTRPSREALCVLFTSVCNRMPNTALDFAELAECLSGMNSFDPNCVDDEPDFDRRSSCFAKLKAIANRMDPVDGLLWWLPVLALSMHGLLDIDELSTRTQALFLIDSLLDNHSQRLELVWEDLIEGQIWSGIRHNMRTSKNEEVRSGLMSLLAKLVSTFPHTRFSFLIPLLADGDEEANVLINLGHIQVHRRTRATRRLGEFICSNEVPKGIIEDIFLAYLWSMVVEPGVDAHLQTEAIQTCSILVSRLPVKSIVSKFLSALKKLQFTQTPADLEVKKKLPAAARAILRYISALVTAINERIDDEVAEGLVQRLFESTASPANSLSYLQLAESIGILIGSRESLLSRFLPKLMATLCQGLRDRDLATRDASRTALCRLMTKLGPSYLSYAMTEMQAILIPLSHGRIRASSGAASIGSNNLFSHVYGYSAACLVESISLSTLLDDEVFFKLLDVVLQHGMGVLATEKTTGKSGASGQEWHGRAIEARTQKSYQLLSTLVSVSTLPQLLSLVERVAEACGLVSVDVEQVDQIFSAIQKSLLKLDMSRDLLVLLHEMLIAKVPSTPMEVNGYRFALLAIECLIKTVESLKEKEMLDGFIAPLINIHIASSKHAALMAASVRCISSLIAACPSSVSFTDADLMERLVGRLFEILVKTDAKQASIISSALKCISMTVRHLPVITLTDSQVKALLSFTREHLEHVSSGNSAIAFSLVKTLLSRRIVLVELFDLMRTVGEKLVIAADSSVRAQCRSVYLLYLLEYPLGPGKVRESIGMLVKNMSAFEWDTGRHSCIQMLASLVQKMPAEMVAEWSSLILVTAASRILLEPNEPCLKAIKELVKTVSLRLSLDSSLNQALQETCTLVKKWMESEKQSVILSAWILSSPIVAGLGTDPFQLVTYLKNMATQTISTENTTLLLAALDCVAQFDEPIEKLDSLLLYPSAEVRSKVNTILLENPSQLKSTAALVQQIIELPATYDDIDTLVKCVLLSVNSDEAADPQHFVRLEKHVRQVLSDPQVTLENKCTLEATVKFLAGYLVSHETTDHVILEPLAAIAIRISTCDHLSATQSSSIDRSIAESLRTSAQQLLELLQKSLGADVYSSLTQRVIQSAAKSKAKRKAAISQLAVNDPEAYARRKMARNAAKKSQRKRKVDVVRAEANKRTRL